MRMTARQIGRTLAARRAFLGLEQEEVARRARTTRGYLSRLERGEAQPSPEMLSRLLTALKVDRPSSGEGSR